MRSLLDQSSMLTLGHGQPSVVYDAAHCRYELWMADQNDTEVNMQPVAFNNMSGVIHATSTDGLSWTRDNTRDLVWDAGAPPSGENLGLLTGADIAQKGTGRYMVYVGFSSTTPPATPNDAYLPARAGGAVPGVMTLNLATRDAPP